MSIDTSTEDRSDLTEAETPEEEPEVEPETEEEILPEDEGEQAQAETPATPRTRRWSGRVSPPP